jgi:3-oxoacyl-(acyl-carrier-protein) synthase
MGERRGEGDSEQKKPSAVPNHPHPGPPAPLPAYRERGKILRVSDDLLTNPATNAQLRRADRFTRMAVLAASDAWNAANVSGIPPERIGLIVSSGFGPHCRGFRFLDGILDAGDTAASPTDFSHSVHGAASAYISRMLDIRGPALALTDFEIGFEEAVRVAQCWLNENACDRVLIGAVEELGAVYLDCAARMLDGSVSPGEGAMFLVLGPANIPGLARLDATASPAAVDLAIVEDPVVLPATKVVAPVQAKQTVTFTGAFGHCASASAFALLGGLLTLRGGAIDTAATLRTSSEGRLVTLLLGK